MIIQFRHVLAVNRIMHYNIFAHLSMFSPWIFDNKSTFQLEALDLEPHLISHQICKFPVSTFKSFGCWEKKSLSIIVHYGLSSRPFQFETHTKERKRRKKGALCTAALYVNTLSKCCHIFGTPAH